jgi:phage-related protein
LGGADKPAKQDNGARTDLFFHDGVLYALHGFIKKTEKTPDDELRLARSRMKEVQNG